MVYDAFVMKADDYQKWNWNGYCYQKRGGILVPYSEAVSKCVNAPASDEDLAKQGYWTYSYWRQYSEGLDVEFRMSHGYVICITSTKEQSDDSVKY